MDRVARFLIICIAIACAIAAAVIALPILSLTDPVTREAGVLLFVTGILSSIMLSSGPEEAAGTLFLLLRVITVAICVAPLLTAVVVGELARLRSWLWYACCSGFVAAAVPWILRLGAGGRRIAQRSGENAAAQAEGRFLLLFFLTGVIAGTVYWLIAGRTAGRDGPAPEGN